MSPCSLKLAGLEARGTTLLLSRSGEKMADKCYKSFYIIIIVQPLVHSVTDISDDKHSI